MPDLQESDRKNSRGPLLARIVGTLFNSALWGMVIALAFNKWTWLEMRFNIGWIFYGTWIVLFVLLMWRRRKPFSFAFSCINTVLCAIASFALCGGVKQMLMIPACLVREGVFQVQWNITAVNIGMLLFTIIFLTAIALLDRKGRNVVPKGNELGK